MCQLLGSGFYAEVRECLTEGALVLHKSYFVTPFAPQLCEQEQRAWRLLNPYLEQLGLAQQLPARQGPISWTGARLPGQPEPWQPRLKEPWQQFIAAWLSIEPRLAQQSLRQQLATLWPRAKLALNHLSPSLARSLQQAVLNGLGQTTDQLSWDLLTHGDLHWQNLLWQDLKLCALIDPWQAGFRHPVWEQAMMIQPASLDWWRPAAETWPHPFERLWLARVLMDLQHLFFVPQWQAESYFQGLWATFQAGDWQAWVLIEP